MTRREFCTGYLRLMALGTALPALATRSVFAQAASTARHLVVVQLFGGNDGLNTVVPMRNPLYPRYRPVLAIPASQCIPLNGDYGLNPALSGIRPLWDAGSVAVVQGVGHPLSDRSHFTSTAIWETADLGSSPDAGTGWLGRYLDSLNQPPHTAALGLTVSNDIPQTFTSRTAPISAVDDLAAFHFQPDGAYVGDEAPFMAALRTILTHQATESAARGFIRDSALATVHDAQAFLQVSRSYASAQVYPPTQIGQRLQTIAKVISGGAAPRVHLAMQPGYDNHSLLPTYHPPLLRDLGDALSAFTSDLKLHGLYNDVTIVTFSEFGRRVKENASKGVDHGHGSCLFVMGGSVKGGMYGTYPSLEPEDLVDGDLKQTVDFRVVYATLLERWMGANPEPLLGGRFDRLGFL